MRRSWAKGKLAYCCVMGFSVSAFAPAGDRGVPCLGVQGYRPAGCIATEGAGRHWPCRCWPWSQSAACSTSYQRTNMQVRLLGRYISSHNLMAAVMFCLAISAAPQPAIQQSVEPFPYIVCGCRPHDPLQPAAIASPVPTPQPNSNSTDSNMGNKDHTSSSSMQVVWAMQSPNRCV